MDIFKIVASLLLLSGCVATQKNLRVDEGSLSKVDVRTLEGASFSLIHTIANHDATVLVWWAKECPCVRRYQSRVEQLHVDLAKQNIAVIYIASNADDSINDVKNHFAEREIAVPVMYDHGGKLADALGVRSTPTSVLLDSQGRIRFRGWIDNERMPGESGRKAYLMDAIRDIKGSTEITQAWGPCYGCMITKSL